MKSTVQKHPSTPKPSTSNLSRKENLMIKKTKNRTTPTTTLPIGTTTSPPTTVSDMPGTPAPATVASAALRTTAPPSIILPATPAVSPHLLAASRGAFPRAGQVAAVPAVLLELKGNTSFEATFGPLVPAASYLVTDLANAAGWTTLRQALVALLLYVRSEEALNWTQAKRDLEALDVVFQGVAAHNPELLDELPALARLLDVTKQIGQRGAATRAARAKAKAAQAATTPAPAAGATTAPVASGGGGGAH